MFTYLIFQETDSFKKTIYVSVCLEEPFLTYLSDSIEHAKEGIKFAVEGLIHGKSDYIR